MSDTHRLQLGQIISLKSETNCFANQLLMYVGEGSVNPIFMDITGKREAIKLDHTKLYSSANVDIDTYKQFEKVLKEFLDKTQSLLTGLKQYEPFELEKGQYVISEGRYDNIATYTSQPDLHRLQQDGLLRAVKRVKELKQIREFNRLLAFVAMHDKDYEDGEYQVIFNNTSEKWESAKYDKQYFQPGVVLMSHITAIELANVLNRKAFVL